MNKLKRKAKVALSHLLYLVGDGISVLMRWGILSFLYPLYNWCMLTSAKLQGPSGDGPWTETNILEKAKKALEEDYPGITWGKTVEGGSIVGRFPPYVIASEITLKVTFDRENAE